MLFGSSLPTRRLWGPLPEGMGRDAAHAEERRTGRHGANGWVFTNGFELLNRFRQCCRKRFSVFQIPPHYPSRKNSVVNTPESKTGNVKKCAVGKHPKSEKHGNTAQFSEVERSGTQENCGGIGSGCRLRLHPLPVLRRRQSHRVACIDPDAVVVDKNIAKNDRFDLFSR